MWIKPINVLERIAAMPDDEVPPTMDAINAIAHAVRQTL